MSKQQKRQLKKDELKYGHYITTSGRLVEYEYYSFNFFTTPDNKIIISDIEINNNRFYEYNEEILSRVNIVCGIKRKRS